MLCLEQQPWCNVLLREWKEGPLAAAHPLAQTLGLKIKDERNVTMGQGVFLGKPQTSFQANLPPLSEGALSPRSTSSSG